MSTFAAVRRALLRSAILLVAFQVIGACTTVGVPKTYLGCIHANYRDTYGFSGCMHTNQSGCPWLISLYTYQLSVYPWLRRLYTHKATRVLMTLQGDGCRHGGVYARGVSNRARHFSCLGGPGV